MDDLLAEFISETQETLEALAGEVVAWEADPTDGARLDAIFRFFHTVKGSCGFLHLPRFEKLSHAAEDVLSEIRAGKRIADPVTVNAVLSIMDRIGELSEAVAIGAALPNENDELLISGLYRASEQSLASTDIATRSAEAINPATDRREPQQSPLRTIRLPLSLIDQLMNGVSDMVLARNELSRKLRDRMVDPDLESAFDRLSTCVADMRDAISKTRMQRVERLFAAIPRMVRDLGRDLGKRIDLTLEGGDVEMDREMVEMVVDPLTHIVRNSIDHGIETPEQRLLAGKPEAGALRLVARQSGNQIVIEVSDDGRGIDSEALVRKAIANGHIDPKVAAGLSEEARLELIFAAGLSTAEHVTSISGRGVGMDVVRANIERIGGLISLENTFGKGLKITLRVPLTLTIIPGLIVKAGGLQFAIPRAAVVEILHDTNATLTLHAIGGACIATVRGVRHSMIDLEDVLGLPKLDTTAARSIMVVRGANGIPYALGVEAVDNHEELVIRPASPLIMASGFYAGMTLPDNGQPMLLLDAVGIAKTANLSTVSMDEQSSQDAANTAAVEVEMMNALRFREITGEDRLLCLSVVERVEDIPADQFSRSGSRAFVKVDDKLMSVVNGHSQFSTKTVTALRLRDGEREVCYPVAQVMDILQVPSIPEMAVSSGLISGITVIDGEHLEIMDPFALYASIPDEEDIAPSTHALCIVADGDDPWARDILAPLLRQAGHQVIFGLDTGDEAASADIVFSTSPLAAEIMDKALPPVVQLRRSARPQSDNDSSIYRYDRAALLAAIDAVRSSRGRAA